MSHSAVPSCIVKGLEITEIAGKQFVGLHSMFTQKEMPVSTINLIDEEGLSRWSYLKDVYIPRINADVD